MNAETRARASLLVRILTTPVGPPIFPSFTRGAGPRQVIAAAALPTPEMEVVTQTVRKTRLWRRERAEVARELCSHFAEGAALGRSGEELIREFGDPARAAALIRRAKIRGRPLPWRAWRRFCQGIGTLVLLCIALYAVLALRYYRATPVISRDYIAELNAPIAAVPLNDRAEPVYRRAVEALPPHPAGLFVGGDLIRPENPWWPDVKDYLAQSRESLELARLGAAKPALGAELMSASEPKGSARSVLDAAWGRSYGQLRTLSWLLVEDAYRAAEESDGATAIANLSALLRLGDHAREAPFLVNDSIGFAMFGLAIRATGTILSTRPEILSNEGLVELAHRLSAAGGGPFTFRTSGERALFLDIVQRIYSDDGNGGGHLSGSGTKELWAESGAFGEPLGRSALAPIDCALLPGRREVIGEYDRLVAAACEQASKPLFARTEDPDNFSMESMGSYKDHGMVGTYATVGAMIPDFGAMSVGAERLTQRRDAVLVAIALELYRRAHGSYPDSLEALTPKYLPGIPIDRFDGKPIKYKLAEGRPLLYSVGVDGVDDGGRPPPGGRDPSKWFSPARLREARRSPAVAAQIGLGGDWILLRMNR